MKKLERDVKLNKKKYLIHTLAVSFIFSFWSFEISEGILDNPKIIIGLE